MRSAKDIGNYSMPESRLVDRRSFLVGAGVATVGATLWWVFGRNSILAEATPAPAGAAKTVTIIGFKDDGTPRFPLKSEADREELLKLQDRYY